MFQLARYVAVGGVLFGLDLACFLGLTELGVATPAAQVVSRALGALVGFFAHKHLTFQGWSRPQALDTRAQLLRYAGITAFNVLLSAGVISACIHLMGGLRVPGKVLGEVLMVLTTWLLSRHVFRPQEAA